MKNNDFATLNDLAKEIGCNKSRMYYYYSKGYIKPVAEIGGMFVFKKLETVDLVKTLIENNRRKTV